MDNIEINFRDYWLNVKNWIELQDARSRVLLLLTALLLLYFLWDVSFSARMTKEIHQYISQITLLKAQVAAAKKQRDEIEKSSTRSPNPVLVQQEKTLQKQLAAIQQKRIFYTKQLVTPEQMPEVLKALIDDPNLTVMQMTNSAPVSALPSEVEKNNLAPDTKGERLYQHNLALTLTGDYFSVVHYLQRLEKLPWQLHWDGLFYEVTHYPEARIQLKLHLLSTKESLLDA